MLSELQLVYMVHRNSTQLLKINITKFQVEREPVYPIYSNPSDSNTGPKGKLFNGKLPLALTSSYNYFFKEKYFFNTKYDNNTKTYQVIAHFLKTRTGRLI